jgi:DNA-binding XRE family transcriptional regulator
MNKYQRPVRRAEDEDVATARLIRKSNDAIAAGEEIVLPKAVVDRFVAGDNPVRVLREWRQMTQMELAVKIGITQGYLSDLESGKRKGPLELHRKISRALEVPLEMLMPIAVSEEAADPAQFAKRKQAIAEMKRLRRRR